MMTARPRLLTKKEENFDSFVNGLTGNLISSVSNPIKFDHKPMDAAPNPHSSAPATGTNPKNALPFDPQALPPSK
jgi:hypothetical protein